MADRVRVGCSSWTSEAWWTRVYPRGLAEGQRLGLYSRLYDTVEVDSTYYATPRGSVVRRWASLTPPGFTFALKFPRDLMDQRKAVEAEAVRHFLSQARELGPKLGPVLLQFPPWFRPVTRNQAFLHDLLKTLDPALRYSVELRHATWFTGEAWEWVKRVLTEHGSALTWSSLTYVDVPAELTSDLLYLRFIGDHVTVPAAIHGEIRVDRALEMRLWAARVREVLPRVREAFAYFNNHFQGFAPGSANLFRSEMGMEPVDYSSALHPAPPLSTG